MKTIKQPVEVSFHHVSVADAVVMLPIMDDLATKVRGTILEIEKDGMTEAKHKLLFTTWNQIQVMAGLGFVTSQGNEDFPNQDHIHQLIFGHE